MIEAQDLTMKYGSVVALKNASFKVGKGEVVGLLGPNGAGKSTTMKIITTYLVPTSGTAKVGGHDVVDDPIPVRKLMGYLPEVLPLYLNMEVAEYLDFVGRARGLSGAKLRERTKWVVERCGLKPMYRRPIQELSKGYRQRTGLAQALIHDPEIVILDEPTSGLDPHQIQEVRALIREIAASKTVILSTHILQEAEAMSDRIIIINQGQIISQGTLTQLRSQAHETNRVHFSVNAPRAEADKALDGIASIKLRTFRAEEKGCCSFALVGADAAEMIDAVGKLALEKKWRVAELTDVPYSLEETFLTLTHSAYAKKGGAA
jgi:ABC-2 type transport system ATP-binding protein